MITAPSMVIFHKDSIEVSVPLHKQVVGCETKSP